MKRRMLAAILASVVYAVAATATAQELTPELVAALQRGGYVLLIRHATPERVNEPTPMDLANCAAQHRLTDKGREEARALGAAFQALKIPVGQVLASGYCRTLETARLAFGRAEPADILLHPIYAPIEGAPAVPPYPQRVELLKKLTATPPALGTNIVAITHGENLRDVVGSPVREAETVIYRPDGRGGSELVGKVQVTDWVAR